MTSAPRSRSFAQVDVFSATPLRGNPLAVVADADGLDAATMQAVAAWTGLSETTFLLPPTVDGADYRVRIFTPTRELPFAGHPTLGTASVWLAAGGTPRGQLIVQECAAGLVEVRRDGDALAFAAPPLTREGPVSAEELAALAGALRIDVADVLSAVWADNGPGWCVVELGSAAEVLAVEPDFAAFPRRVIGLVGRHPAGHDALLEVRGLVGEGYEDPVTGSLNAGIARWLLGRGDVQAPYIATQGARRGRDGRVHVDVDDAGTIWVGGHVSPVISGTVAL
ncbi:PhzF family phenazine biosynthesis protein [Brachybacterium sp. AOP25-B2-12]|uniref:PhzF family phenazine biosynthesis protein n=1 Tax=Brachybacterium sp. AOP25-B2-12 TaxID=3457710 RepID=UPI004034B021